MALLRTFVDEQEHVVWTDMVGAIESFIFLYHSEPFFGNFRKFALSILRKIAEYLALWGTRIDEEIAKVASDPLKMVRPPILCRVYQTKPNTLTSTTAIQEPHF